MSTAEAVKPSPHLLDSVPPDTRVVIHDVTWNAYENLVDALGERANCRVAFDGKDIETWLQYPGEESAHDRPFFSV